MVTLREAAQYIKELGDCEWWVLKKVFFYTKYYERVPLKLLIKQNIFKEDYLRRCIKRLHKYGLVEFFQQPYESLRLYTRGADLLALKRFSDRGLIQGVGRQIGIGKESDIYEVLGFDSKKYSLKIFRLGRISFRQVRKKRDYGAIDKWTPWIYRNISAAKKEFEILRHLYLRGAPVPRPVYRIMHMVLMDFLDGFLLNDVDLDNKDVLPVLERIIGCIKIVYDLGFVNGDLSPFNVFVLKDGDIILIDWPQAVNIDDSRANQLLKRDIENIVKYFIRKYGVKADQVKKILKRYDFHDIVKF